MANIKLATNSYITSRNLVSQISDTRSVPYYPPGSGTPTDATNTQMLLLGEDLTDSSNYARSMTLIGTTPPASDAFGYDNNSLKFVDGQIKTTFSTALNPWSQTSYQFDCWVYETQRGTSSQPVLFGHMNYNNGINYWSFGPDNIGRLLFYFYDGASRSRFSTFTIPLNTWTHIAFSLVSGQLRMFADGVKVYDAAASGGQSSASIPVGFGEMNNKPFIGYMDNARILTNDPAIWTADFTPPDSYVIV